MIADMIRESEFTLTSASSQHLGIKGDSTVRSLTTKLKQKVMAGCFRPGRSRETCSPPPLCLKIKAVCSDNSSECVKHSVHRHLKASVVYVGREKDVIPKGCDGL